MFIAAIPWWLQWNFEPLPIVVLLSLAIGYWYIVGPVRRTYHLADSMSRGKAACFYSGIFALAVALVTPLDSLGMNYLLTAHMIQHVIFSVIAPPLLLFGTPSWMLEPLFRTPRARKIGRALTHPFTTFGLYNLNMWVWHIPVLLDAEPPRLIVRITVLADTGVLIGFLLTIGLIALPRILPGQERRARNARMWISTGSLLVVLALAVLGPLNAANWPAPSRAHNPVHLLMDFCFVGTALLYWMPILSPIPDLLPRISSVFGMFYLFISTQPMMALGAIIVFSPRPLYSLYADAPLLLGATHLGDQQLAGLIMWLIMDIPLIVGISILFFRWMGEMDRKEVASAGQLSPEDDDLIWQHTTTSTLPTAGGVER